MFLERCYTDERREGSHAHKTDYDQEYEALMSYELYTCYFHKTGISRLRMNILCFWEMRLVSFQIGFCN